MIKNITPPEMEILKMILCLYFIMNIFCLTINKCLSLQKDFLKFNLIVLTGNSSLNNYTWICLLKMIAEDLLLF